MHATCVASRRRRAPAWTVRSSWARATELRASDGRRGSRRHVPRVLAPLASRSRESSRPRSPRRRDRDLVTERRACSPKSATRTCHPSRDARALPVSVKFFSREFSLPLASEGGREGEEREDASVRVREIGRLSREIGAVLSSNAPTAPDRRARVFRGCGPIAVFLRGWCLLCRGPTDRSDGQAPSSREFRYADPARCLAGQRGIHRVAERGRAKRAAAAAGKTGTFRDEVYDVCDVV